MTEDRVLSFEGWTLDLDAFTLTRGATRARLSPKAFGLLQALVRAAPKAVSKADLQRLLWPRTFVVEANLPNLVAEIRAALGDDSALPRFVRTVHGYGYAFCAEARSLGSSDRTRPGDARYWLFVGRAAFPLGDGDHLLGRNADSVVPLGSPAVSRRHAQLTIDERRAVLFDLASKNGTYLRGVRVDQATALRSHDEIRIGPFYLTLVACRASHATDTDQSAGVLLPQSLPPSNLEPSRFG